MKDNTILHSYWIAALALVTTSHCASLSLRPRVEVRSEPAGAEVVNRGGEVLGTTPLTLENETLLKATESDRLYLTVRAKGYVARNLILDVHGNDVHDVKLPKMEDTYFAEQAIPEFQVPINQMVRDLLRIQGLLIVQKRDQAEKDLDLFQKHYPNIAASYVMQANLALMKGKRDNARGYLLRAQSIDPTDPVISRMLKGIEGGTP